MNKKPLMCLGVISLLLGAIAVTMFSPSEARAQGDGIIVDGEDDISTIANEYSAELANVTGGVTSRAVVEYGDFGSKLELNRSGELDQAAGAVSSRVAVEYADFAFAYGLQRSDALVQADANVTPRIIVEYADFMFGTSLGPNPVEIIPEFSSPIILLLLMMLSALALAFIKRTRRKLEVSLFRLKQCARPTSRARLSHSAGFSHSHRVCRYRQIWA
jgi:hypothetical protein